MQRPPGYDKLKRVRRLRRDMTDAEIKLWSRIRANQLGVEFRKQTWLAGFIADFESIEAKLVIEVDGGQHDVRQTEDAARAAAMKTIGYRTIRFWNHDVLQNIDGVLMTIQAALPSPSHRPGGRRSPPSPQVGEGS
jgi:very-short-patch-repair endonuclease